MDKKSQIKGFFIEKFPEMLQTSNSIECFPYGGVVEVSYKTEKEVLEHIQSEVSHLYPIFCSIFLNLDDMQQNAPVQEGFQKKLLLALKFIMRNKNRYGSKYVYQFSGVDTVDNDGCGPTNEQMVLYDFINKTFFSMYSSPSSYLQEILDYILLKGSAKFWALLVTKLAFIHRSRDPTTSQITSNRFYWHNEGQDGWEDKPKSEGVLRSIDTETDIQLDYEFRNQDVTQHLAEITQSLNPGAVCYFEYDSSFISSLSIRGQHFEEIPLWVENFPYLEKIEISCTELKYYGGSNRANIKQALEHRYRSYSTMLSKIQKETQLDKYDLTHPKMNEIREKLIDACDLHPCRANEQNKTALESNYYFQNFKFKKADYFLMKKLAEMVSNRFWIANKPEQTEENWDHVLFDLNDYFMEERHYSELVVVLDNNEIIGLVMANQGLTHLPDNIGDLRNLKYLKCPKNILSSLPASFSKLSNLECLDLQNNRFETYPFELQSIRRIWNISKTFKKNPIKEQFDFESEGWVEESTFFDYLQILYYIHTWSLPNLFSRLSNNRKLKAGDLLAADLLTHEKEINDFCENHKTSAWFRNITERIMGILEERKLLQKIEEILGEKIPILLDFQYEKKFGLELDGAHVKRLKLSGKNFDSLPSNIGALKYLEELDISHTNIKRFPGSFKNLTRLTYLWCEGAPLISLSNLPPDNSGELLCNLLDGTSETFGKSIQIASKYEKNSDILKYFAKTPMELATQMVQKKIPLTPEEEKRLAYEGDYQERQILESVLPPNHYILIEITKRLQISKDQNVSLLL